jgi:hypothetical protein
MVDLAPLVLYCLKRDFGGPIDIYQLGSPTVDLTTGIKTSTPTRIHVRRAVILPAKMLRSKIAVRGTANSDVLNLADFGTREFIIERKDVRGYTPCVDDWIIYQVTRYQMAAIEEFECGDGWVVTGKEIVGVMPQQQLAMSIHSQVDVNVEARKR